MATVKLFGELRQYVSARQLDLSADTVRQILNMICDDNMAFGDAIFTDNNLKPFIKITINGRDIQLENGLDTAVSDKDTIAIFPPIAGG